MSYSDYSTSSSGLQKYQSRARTTEEQAAQQVLQLDSCIAKNQESIAMQQDSIRMLKEQERTIDSIDDKLHAVDANNQKSAEIVKQMASGWATFKALFGSKPKPVEVKQLAEPVKNTQFSSSNHQDLPQFSAPEQPDSLTLKNVIKH